VVVPYHIDRATRKNGKQEGKGAGEWLLGDNQDYY
jgi:hypothetical protein